MRQTWSMTSGASLVLLPMAVALVHTGADRWEITLFLRTPPQPFEKRETCRWRIADEKRQF